MTSNYAITLLAVLNNHFYSIFVEVYLVIVTILIDPVQLIVFQIELLAEFKYLGVIYVKTLEVFPNKNLHSFFLIHLIGLLFIKNSHN